MIIIIFVYHVDMRSLIYTDTPVDVHLTNEQTISQKYEQ